MWIAVVISKPVTGGNEFYNWGTIGTDANSVATAAEKQAEAFRNSQPTLSYRTVVAEVTKMVKPPESNITLVDFA